MRLLGEPTSLHLDTPKLSPLQIAFYRGLAGGLVTLAFIRRADLRFRPAMLGMVLVFTAMSGLYLSALGLGPAANAIFLQNTAPVWVYLFAVFLFGERGDVRGWQAVLLGGAGAIVIVAGNWPRDLPPEEEHAQGLILMMGVGSGVFYAAVMIFFRILRAESASWLVVLNLFGTAAVLGLYVLIRYGASEFVAWVSAPSFAQYLLFLVYGTVQLAAPYWLFAYGLRTVSPREAGIITLVEPLLNPVWAYLISPEKDAPTTPMIVGGGLILAALVWRYIPHRAKPGACTPGEPVVK